MTDAAGIRTKPEAPWRSPAFWWVLVPLLVAILGLTMAKDYYLTGDRPNLVFYLTVPMVSIAGSTLGGFVAAKLLRQVVLLVDVLAISLVMAFLGQVFENSTKLVWHLVWSYPGWIYLVAILALGVLVPLWCLVHWLRLRSILALVVALGMFLGELILALAFTSFAGVSTPGS